MASLRSTYRQSVDVLASLLVALVFVSGCGGDSASTPVAPTNPAAPSPPPPPSVQTISVEIDTEEFTVGQTATLTATAIWSDGRREPVTGAEWESSDPEIAAIETTEEGVLLRALSDGSVTVSVRAEGQRGTLGVNVLPLLDIRGTLFVDPDIVTPEDPSVFAAVSYAGRANRVMFDRRLADWVEREAFLFNATYEDGFEVEIQVNPEFETEEAAMAEARKYGWLIGQLPRVLRGPDLQTVWIHRGNEDFGGGNNNLLIHTGRAVEYEGQGILEEVFLHEGAHTSLDPHHKDSEEWLAAQAADGGFISVYARDFPNRDDLAETFPMWFAVRFREDRISARLATTIRSRIPHRLAYLDAQDFDVSPVR